MSRPAHLCGLLLAAAACAGVAPVARAAQGNSLLLNPRLSTYYDDNILQYSDGQIADFEGSFHPDRYSIESVDDVVFVPSLAATWAQDRGRARRQALRARFEGDYHGRNGTADFHSASIALSESWARDRELSLSYYWLPSFYLRQLFDEDVVPPYPGLTKYRRADFSLQIASIEWTQRLRRRLLVTLGYQFEGRNYNHDFDERDSDLHQGVLDLSLVRLRRRGSVHAGGAYRDSRARRNDGDAAPDPDVSYHGMSLWAGGRMELWRAGSWRLLGDLGYELETRTYTSTVTTDRYHYGRDDVRNAIEVGLRTAYRPHWSLRGFYRFQDNTATLGLAAPPAADAGSYRENQVGFAIDWTGAVWSQSGPAPDSESQP